MKCPLSISLPAFVLVITAVVSIITLIMMERDGRIVLLGVCCVVNIVSAIALFAMARKVYDDSMKRNELRNLEVSALSGELLVSTSALDSQESTIHSVSEESEKLNNKCARLENLVVCLRKMTLANRDKLSECSKILEEMRRRAELSDKMKSVFLSNVSHELRTPVHVITGFLSYLVDPNVPIGMRNKFAEDVRNASNRLVDTVNDMFYYSELQAGGVAVHITSFDISALIMRLEYQVRNLIAACGRPLSFRVDNDTKTSCFISGFEIGIYKVLSELLDNAVKFTQIGGITLSYEYAGGWIRFDVSDTGIGIDADKKDKIFTSFMQGEDVLSRNYEGLGLGLSICRSLIALMDGDITVESSTGLGSKFSVVIPVKEANEKDLDVYEQAEKMLSMLRDNDCVLVLTAEDEDFEFINLFFSTYGINVKRCRSGIRPGEEGFCCKDGEVSLAIIDFEEPMEDPIGMAQDIFLHNPNTKFALLCDDESKLHGLGDKIMDYVDFRLHRPLSSQSLGVLLKGW